MYNTKIKKNIYVLNGKPGYPQVFFIYGIWTQYKYSNILKNRSHKGEVTYGRRGVKDRS
jgi:hypothetical protein